jgi:hypothetical protein
LRLVDLWRCVEDPNKVFFLFEVRNEQRAHAFLNSAAAADAGRESGVLEGEWQIVERDSAVG